MVCLVHGTSVPQKPPAGDSQTRSAGERFPTKMETREAIRPLPDQVPTGDRTSPRLTPESVPTLPYVLHGKGRQALRIALALAGDLDDLHGHHFGERVVPIGKVKGLQGFLKSARHDGDSLRIEGGLSKEPPNWHAHPPGRREPYSQTGPVTTKKGKPSAARLVRVLAGRCPTNSRWRIVHHRKPPVPAAGTPQPIRQQYQRGTHRRGYRPGSPYRARTGRRSRPPTRIRAASMNLKA